jgi:hypothetical protein
VISFGASATIWSVDGPAPVASELEGYGFDGRFSSDGALFYLADQSDSLGVIDVVTRRVIGRLPVPPPSLQLEEGQNSVTLQSALVDASTRIDSVLSVGGDSYARVWNVARETRSPEVIARLVASRVMWKLDGATVVPRMSSHAPI